MLFIAFCELAIFCVITVSQNSASPAFPESCQKATDEKEVSMVNARHPRFRLDINLIFFSGENDGVKMMKKFTANVMHKIKVLRVDYTEWSEPWYSIQESKRGLDEVCKNYDSNYKEAFPYSCYSKENWCLLKELFDKLLEQMGTIWKPGGPTLPLTQPWYGFFNAPDNGWSNALINEMKMACESFFHHPLLGSMTKQIRESGEELEIRIINRIHYYVETNQLENLKSFFRRFEWVKQPFVDAAISTGDKFSIDMSHILPIGEKMIADADTFNWDYTLPVPRTREVIAMLWLVIPKSIRVLFPSHSSDAVARERVTRFLQIAFDNVLEKNNEELESLVSHTVKLKIQVKSDCSDPLEGESSGLECVFSRVLEDLERLVELVKEVDWQADASMDLRSATLISFLSTGSRELIEVTFAKLREIVLDIFERFYGYAQQNDIVGLETYMKLMPPLELISIGTERGCSEYFSDLKSKLPCLFQNVFHEILLYMNSVKVAPLNTKVISTTYNFRDQLRGAQLSAISAQIDQRAIEAKANLAEFAYEIKTFVSENTGQRFAALESYFKGMADFDHRKANADIGYIVGRLSSFDEAVKKAQPSVEKKITAIVIGSVVSSGLDVVQRGVELVVKSIFACNPVDPDPGAVFDAANEFAQSVVNLARSAKLAATFKTAFEQTTDIAKRLSQNNDFIETVREIVTNLPNYLQSKVEFSKLTTEFLNKYSAYDPKVQRQEIAKVGTDWEVFLGEACETLFAGGTAAAAIVQTTFAAKGECLTTQGDISNMVEIYSEIYDYQFDLMETLATAVRAYQSSFFAERLDTRLRVLSEQDLASEKDDEIISLNQAMLSFYLIYRIHTLQIVVQYCNFLQFKNAGEMPLACLSAMNTLEQRELSNLIAFQAGTCTPESFKFVDIPTTKPDSGASAAWINMTKLYIGEEVALQIPSFEWLVENKWITRADAKDTAIYLSAFELFLPNGSVKKEKKRSRHFHRRQAHRKSDMFLQPAVAENGTNNQKTPLVRRNSGEQREIQFKTTAKYPAPLFPGEEATKFSLQPYRIYVFAYQENAGSCRQNTIDNPYSATLPKICPLSSPPAQRQVDPSIFSLWKIKLEAPMFESLPTKTGSDPIKAAVRMCKVKKPSTLKKKAKKRAKL